MHAFLAHIGVAEVAGFYGIIDTPMLPQPFVAHNILAFNVGNAPITGDARGFDHPVAACAMAEGGRRLGKGPGRMVFVYLTSGALNRLFGLDPTTLTEPRAIASGESARLDKLSNSLMDVRDDERAIVETVDEHLLDAIEAAPPAGLPEMAHILMSAEPEITIERVAEMLGTSPRTLERRFKSRFGCTLSRFRRHLRLLKSTPSLRDSSWDNVPPDVDYYDQSHWLKDMRTIYGATPKELRSFKPANWLRYPENCFDRESAGDAWDENAFDARWNAYHKARAQLMGTLKNP